MTSERGCKPQFKQMDSEADGESSNLISSALWIIQASEPQWGGDPIDTSLPYTLKNMMTNEYLVVGDTPTASGGWFLDTQEDYLGLNESGICTSCWTLDANIGAHATTKDRGLTIGSQIMLTSVETGHFIELGSSVRENPGFCHAQTCSLRNEKDALEIRAVEQSAVKLLSRMEKYMETLRSWIENVGETPSIWWMVPDGGEKVEDDALGGFRRPVALLYANEDDDDQTTQDGPLTWPQINLKDEIEKIGDMNADKSLKISEDLERDIMIVKEHVKRSPLYKFVTKTGDEIDELFKSLCLEASDSPDMDPLTRDGTPNVLFQDVARQQHSMKLTMDFLQTLFADEKTTIEVINNTRQEILNS